MELSGKVVHGKGLGHQFGMPTANVNCDCRNIKKGVYAGYAYVDQARYLCVINVGTRPSVDNELRDTVEAFILDFDQDIYDKVIKLELVKYLRETIKLNGLKEVKKQVDKDIEETRKLL